MQTIPAEIRNAVGYYARQNDLDESLVYAIIRVESDFDAQLQSPNGAKGLMQIMPETAKQLDVQKPFDAWENIRGGTTYLAQLLERFDGDLQLSLAGYKAGPEKVEEFNGVPPDEETQNFVRRVIGTRNDYHGGDSIAVVSSNNSASDYLVQFTSGHTQRAQNVVDDGDHYIIECRGRSFRVRKSQIVSVTQPR